MTMVEKMAQARTGKHANFWDEVLSRSIMVSTLKAYRDPSDEMIKSGIAGDNGMTHGDRVTNIWRAMIDFAIKEQEG